MAIIGVIFGLIILLVAIYSLRIGCSIIDRDVKDLEMRYSNYDKAFKDREELVEYRGQIT